MPAKLSSSMRHGLRTVRGRRRFVNRVRPLVATLALGALLGPLMGAQPAYANNTAGMTLTKSITATELVPGETFTYSMQVGCSVLTQECINATLTDTIPSQFIVGAPGTLNITPAVPADITVSGQQVTVAFRSIAM